MANEEKENQCPPYVPGLGEVPRDLLYERGDLPRFDTTGKYNPPRIDPATGVVHNSQVADIARPTAIIEDMKGRQVPKTPPPLYFRVQSTYDSRPIQAYDFQANRATVINFETSGDFDPVSMTYTVPENTIAVIRGYRYQASPVPIGIVTEGTYWLQSDFFDNDVPVREHVGMYHAVFMRQFIPTFFIVDERHVLTFQVSQNPDAEISDSMDGETIGLLFEIYGNLIPKTGIPKEYEIASPY